MDSRRLTYFLTIADEGSINRASSVLGIAQPALSRQVRLLESDLGVTLLRRTSRGVTLTEEGERLRASTAGPLRQLELAMRYAGSPLARIDRGIHVGLISTAADAFALPLLELVSSTFPAVDFRVTVAGADELAKDMLRGSVDIAVTVPTANDRLFHGDLVAEELVVVGSCDSSLDPATQVRFDDAARNPLILPLSRSGIRASIENTALRRKAQLSARFSTDSVALAKELVERGHGFTFLPLAAILADVAAQRLRYAPLIEPRIDQRLSISVGSKTDLPRGILQRLSEVIRDEALRLVRSNVWPATLSEDQGRLRP